MRWLLLVITASAALAGDPHTARTHITAGDAAYRQGVQAASAEEASAAFAQAAAEYSAAIEAGAANGYVLYNRGNARLKSGRLGAAIADYERALALLPRLGDLRANLRYAEAAAAGEPQAAAPHDLLTPLLAPHTRTTLAETAWAAAALYALTFVLLTMQAVRPSAAVKRAVVAAAVLCAVACASLGVKLWYAGGTRAVVVVDETAVRSGNAQGFAEKYRVAEGTRARVLDERDEWYKIRISRDEVGWIPRGAVEVF